MKLICKHNIHIQTLETPSAAKKEIKMMKIKNSKYHKQIFQSNIKQI